MPKVHLTDRTLKGLATDRVQEEFWDRLQRGFGVRVTGKGRKSFFVRYWKDGRFRRATLGPYPGLKLSEARGMARDLTGQVARGVDPLAVQERCTFDELAELYLEQHAKRKKVRWREDERILKLDLLPAWGGMAADDIDRRAVHAVLDAIVERGAPTMANRTRALASKIFNFGIERDLVDRNPCHGVSRPAPESRRDRFLSESEIRALWRLLEDEGGVVAASLQLRLVTAQRGVEVMTMRWTDFDGDWWSIPADVVKNKRQHTVPLSTQANAVVEGLRPLTGRAEWVFESPKKPGTPIVWVNKICARYCETLGFHFVAHDLRRTAATHMARLGVNRLVIGKILNHADGGVTAIYDRSTYDREKREALDAWGCRVVEIVRGQAATSVPARRSSLRSRSATSLSAHR